MSDIDIKVTIVSKLKGLVLVKADPQVHNSKDRHADTVITSDSDTAESVLGTKMKILFHAASQTNKHHCYAGDN